MVAVICECGCVHSSPASAPRFSKTVTYLKRASRFKSRMRCGVSLENPFDLLVAHARERAVVVGRFDDDFVCPHGAHAVVDPFRHCARPRLRAVERMKVRDARAPGRAAATASSSSAGVSPDAPGRAGSRSRGMRSLSSRMAYAHPTASDGILTKFHGRNCARMYEEHQSKRRTGMLQAARRMDQRT